MSTLEHEKKILEYENMLKNLREQDREGQLFSEGEVQALEVKVEKLKEEIYLNLSAFERIGICRHPDRPKSLGYIKNMCDSFEEIHGDRLYRDDHSMITGFGYIGDQKIVIIAQEKGSDTESRLYRNFGMNYPEGYRKALRAMKLAEKFSIPVLSLIDTPGAFPCLEAEERGQGWAIANNLKEMARLKVPIIALFIGEGCSGGALGIAVADKILMLEHAYYSVITPEGCASILWKDSNAKNLAADALRLHAEDLIEFGIVDKMIKEPKGGAHYDPLSVYQSVKEEILKEIEWLSQLPLDILIERRYQKFRKIGRFNE